MYYVTCDGHPLLDWRDNDLILVNPKVKLEVNTVGQGSFTIYKNHPHYSKLKKLKSVFEIADDYGVIFRGRATRDTIDIDQGMLVDLEGAMAYFNDSVVRAFSFPYDFQEDEDYITAAESGNVIEFFLGWLIDNHNSQVQDFQKMKLGNVTVTDSNNYISRSTSEYASTWEVVKAKLFDSSLGGYLCIRYEADGNFIDYLSEFTETNSQEIVFGENLVDLQSETEASETYSAIIPIGTLGLTVEGLEDKNITDDIVKEGDTLYSKKAVEEYGWIYAPTSETTWDDVTDDSNLLTKGVQWLVDNGTLIKALEATAVDLHFTDEQAESIRIYKNINVRSAPHEVSETFPLSKLELDLLNPQNTKITVGKTIDTLTEQTALQQDEAKKQYSKLSKTDEEIRLEVVASLRNYSTIEQTASSISTSIHEALYMSAEIDVLPRTEYDFVSGTRYSQLDFVLEAGVHYYVDWDDVEYDCGVPNDASSDEYTMLWMKTDAFYISYKYNYDTEVVRTYIIPYTDASSIRIFTRSDTEETERYSTIEQTDSKIAASVSESKEYSDGQLTETLKAYSTTTQTANVIESAIREELYTATTDEDGNTHYSDKYSTITQTANAIESAIFERIYTPTTDENGNTVYTEKYSTIEQTTTSISAAINTCEEYTNTKLGELETAVDYDLNGLKSAIDEDLSDFEDTVNAKFEKYSTTEQTDEKISTAVHSALYVEDGTDEDGNTLYVEKYSTTEQTDEKISTSVSESKEYSDKQLNTKMSAYSTTEQTANSISTSIHEALYMSAEIDVLPRTEYDFVSGTRYSQLDFVLEAGVHYYVDWDDVEYDCGVPDDASSDEYTMLWMKTDAFYISYKYNYDTEVVRTYIIPYTDASSIRIFTRSDTEETERYSTVKQTASSISAAVSGLVDEDTCQSMIDVSLEDIAFQVENNTTGLSHTLRIQDDGVTIVDASGNTVTISGGQIDATDLMLTHSANINDNFIVDESGNVTMNGDIVLKGKITWSATNNPADGCGISEDDAKTLISDELLASPTIKGGEFFDLNDKGRLTLAINTDYGSMPWLIFEDTVNDVKLFEVVPTTESSSQIVLMMGGSTVLRVADGVVYPCGDWDFSAASVTGIN